MSLKLDISSIVAPYIKDLPENEKAAVEKEVLEMILMDLVRMGAVEIIGVNEFGEKIYEAVGLDSKKLKELFGVDAFIDKDLN